MSTSPERRADRRAEDRRLADAVGYVIDWAQKRWVILTFVGSVVVAAAAWFSVQRAVPARMDRLEVRVDSGFRAITFKVDSLATQQQEGTSDRAEMRRGIELLLRMNCPKTKEPTLISECRPYLSQR